jgi:hypothetical protein
MRSLAGAGIAAWDEHAFRKDLASSGANKRMRRKSTENFISGGLFMERSFRLQSLFQKNTTRQKISDPPERVGHPKMPSRAARAASAAIL